MKNQTETDVIQNLVTLIMHSDTSIEETLSMLEALEPSIEGGLCVGEDAGEAGLLTTADDLCS